MYCPKCGTQNPEAAQLCSSCSAVLTNPAAQAPISGTKTSGLAIASLVLGVLSFVTCLITAIPAIILGIVSLVKIGKSAGRLKGTGLAVAGIVVPAVSLIFAPMMLAMLLPALGRSRQIAFRMVCAQNMSGLGRAMLIYANDYDDMFPTSSKWCDLLIEHAEVTPAMFRCRGAHEGPCNYAINKNIENFNTGNAPPDMVVLFETHPGWNQAGGPELLSTDNHQGDGCNVLFVDGHVVFVKTEDLEHLSWTAEEGIRSIPYYWDRNL